MKIKDPYGFIYITTNMVNGKRYIGQRKFYKGWKTYLGSGDKLKTAIKKYRKENFYRDIVAIAYSKEELDKLEIEFIFNYNATKSRKFYNISHGGEGGNNIEGKSEKEKEIIKRKISIANRGKNNSFYGKHHSESTIKKLRNINKGKFIGEKSPFAKKVICVDTNEIFKSVCDVSRKYNNFSISHISACCRNDKKQAYNKLWMFLDDFNKLSKEEIELKLKESKKGIKGSNNPNARKIICLNNNEVFDSIQEASDKYNIIRSVISNCCSKNYKSAKSKKYGKLVFRYYEDFLKMTNNEIQDAIMYGKYNSEYKDKIICIDNKKIYYCSRQVEEETGLFATSITACCKGKYKRVGKLRWMYYDYYLKISKTKN